MRSKFSVGDKVVVFGRAGTIKAVYFDSAGDLRVLVLYGAKESGLAVGATSVPVEVCVAASMVRRHVAKPRSSRRKEGA